MVWKPSPGDRSNLVASRRLRCCSRSILFESHRERERERERERDRDRDKEVQIKFVVFNVYSFFFLNEERERNF